MVLSCAKTGVVFRKEEQSTCGALVSHRQPGADGQVVELERGVGDEERWREGGGEESDALAGGVKHHAKSAKFATQSQNRTFVETSHTRDLMQYPKNQFSPLDEASTPM